MTTLQAVIATGIIVFVVIGILMVFYYLKNRMLFHPLPLPQNTPLPPGVEHTKIEVEPGVALALYHTKETNPSKSKPIVYCHGNAGNAAACFYLFRYCQHPVVVWDYRGFGDSGGQPTVQNVVSDLQKVIQWTADHYETNPEDIILWGRSLGTNVVMQHVDKVSHPCTVVLHTPFSKLSDVMKCLGYGWISWMCRLVGNMDVRKNMKNLIDRGGKALVIASRDDNVTPWESALELVLPDCPDTVLKEVPGSHYTAFEDWDTIHEFIQGQ